MVNLKDYELEAIKERKHTNTIQLGDRFFVCLNRKRKRLPPFLKWRIDQCQILQDDYMGYNLMFELMDYQEVGDTFANVVTLELVRFTVGHSYDVIDEKWETFLIPYSIKTIGGKPFSFQVQLKDLDTYFKRFHPTELCDIYKKIETSEDGIEFRVTEDTVNKKITVTNVYKMLVDCPEEPLFTASVMCHKDDTYDYNFGKNLAIEKWKEKFRKWFYNYTTNKTKEQKDMNTTKSVKLTNMETKETTTTKVTINCDTSFVKDLTNKEAVGTKIGDYVVEKLFNDGHKHLLWKLVCPTCGDTIYTTRTKLERNQVNVLCKNCWESDDDIKFDSTTNNKSNSEPTDDMEDINPTADFMSDPDNYTVTTGQLATDTELDKQGKSETTCSVSTGTISLTEIHGDLFNAPVWSYVAHCINADFGFYGHIAETIDDMWNMGKRLKHDYDLDSVSVGSVCVIDNVFNLIVAPNRYTPPTLNTLGEAVQEMAETCYALGVTMVSMPKLCCGRNKLQWFDVRPMIVDIFNRVYTYKNDRYNNNQTIDLCVYSI